MAIEGYVDYKRREFCNDVKCKYQLDLNTQEQGSVEYENVRQKCKTGCLYTTYQFHHWLIEKGFIVARPEHKE